MAISASIALACVPESTISPATSPTVTVRWVEGFAGNEVGIVAHRLGMVEPIAQGTLRQVDSFVFDLASPSPVVVRLEPGHGLGLAFFADGDERIDLVNVVGEGWRANSSTAALLPLGRAEGLSWRFLQEVDDRANALRTLDIDPRLDGAFSDWFEQRLIDFERDASPELTFLIEVDCLCMTANYVTPERASAALGGLAPDDWRWILLETDHVDCLSEWSGIGEVRRQLANHPDAVVRARMLYLDAKDAFVSGDDARVEAILARLQSIPLRSTDEAAKAAKDFDIQYPLRIGRKVPAFRMQTSDGVEITSESLRGRIYVLHVASLHGNRSFQSGTWLPYEIDYLRHIHEYLVARGGHPPVELISIFVDELKDLGVLNDHPVTWTFGTNPKLFESWGIVMPDAPQLLLIDADGTLRASNGIYHIELLELELAKISSG